MTTYLAEADSVTFTSSHPNVVNVLYASGSVQYREAYTIMEAINVGSATITAKVYCNGVATETVSIEIYVVMEDGVYAIKSEATHLPTNLGDYYLRVQNPGETAPTIVASTHTYGGVPDNIYRYWKIEYAGNGRYYIRCVADQDDLLYSLGSSVTVSSNYPSEAASLWKIQYRRSYGSGDSISCIYEIASYANDVNGVVLSASSATEALYNSSSPYYYAPVGVHALETLDDLPFQQWSFEPVTIEGLYFTNKVTGTVSETFSTSIAVVAGEMFDLDDLGYALVNVNGDSTSNADWRSPSQSVVTVDESSGIMTSVGAGTTTVTAAVDGEYASFTLTVVIKPLADGIYFLRNLGTRLYATIQSGTMSDGHGIGQYTFQGSNIQKWKFVYQSGGNIYTIQSAQNETYYLGTANNASAVGTNIVLRTGTVTTGMKWRITQGANGYEISAYSSSSRVVAANSSSTEENLTIVPWTNDTNYQDEWGILIEDYQSIFVNYRVPSKTFTLQCKGTLAQGSTWWYPLIHASAEAWNSTVFSNITVSNSVTSVYTCEVNSYAENWFGLTTSYTDSYGRTTRATIKINSRTCDPNSNSRKSTITHEIGHLFGLKDNPPISNPSMSLMHYGRDRAVIYQPQSYDVKNVNYIYHNW